MHHHLADHCNHHNRNQQRRNNPHPHPAAFRNTTAFDRLSLLFDQNRSPLFLMRKRSSTFHRIAPGKSSILLPSWYTATIFCVLRISVSGSASRTSRSARFPTTIVPRSPTCSSFAFSPVAAVIAC